MGMWIKNIVFLAFFASFMPVVAFGTVAYIPSRPCGCNTGWVPAYPSAGCGYQQYGLDYAVGGRNFQRINNVQQQQDDEEARSRGQTASMLYVSGRVFLNMMSWEDEYATNYIGSRIEFNKDTYSLEKLYGGSVALGMRFDSGWRGELEVGMNSKFTDKEEYATYTMSVPFAMLNVYYDFDSGFYLGAGLGAAKPKTTMELRLPYGTTDMEKSVISPRLGGALGFLLEINENAAIDLGGRASAFKGTNMPGEYLWDEYEDGNLTQYNLRVEAGWITEYSISVGLRYQF